MKQRSCCYSIFAVQAHIGIRDYFRKTGSNITPDIESTESMVGPRMMMKIVAVIIGCLAVTGCALWPWEPLPSWNVQEITIDQVPRRVLGAMHAAYAEAVIQKTERSTFGSRIQGYPKEYRFTFLTKSNTVETTVFDEKGVSVGSDMWFQGTETTRAGGPTTGEKR